MNKHKKKYFDIKKRKEKVQHIKSKYVYYPFYDTENNSPINRYRLWTKYRDECVKNNFKYVSFKEYGKILHQLGDKIQNELLTNPDGVNFKGFKVKLNFYRKDLMDLVILDFKPRYTKKDIINLKCWTLHRNEDLFKKSKKLKKEGVINDYTFSIRQKQSKHILKDLNFFNDF